MSLFLVDYDLNNPGKNYDSLISAIKSYSCAKICKSSWAIKADSSAEQIRNHLSNHIDRNDTLFVCKISDWASWNLASEVGKWLNQ